MTHSVPFFSTSCFESPLRLIDASCRGKGEEIHIAVTFGDAGRSLRKICHAIPVPFPRPLQ
jgi:hypothetical protein